MEVYRIHSTNYRTALEERERLLDQINHRQTLATTKELAEIIEAEASLTVRQTRLFVYPYYDFLDALRAYLMTEFGESATQSIYDKYKVTIESIEHVGSALSVEYTHEPMKGGASGRSGR